MPISFVRIDDRLVHGQVVEGWLPALRVNSVVVVSESAACDELRKTLMRLALPDKYKFGAFDAKMAAQYLKNLPPKEYAMVLADRPAEVLSILRAGVRFDSVNVGGMHFAAGKMQIGRAFFLDDADKRNFRDIISMGIMLEGRGVPADNSENFGDIIGEES